MTPALIALLIQEFGPPVAALLVAVINTLTQTLTPSSREDYAAAVAVDIYVGITKDHPDWAPAQVHQWTVDAITAYLTHANLPATVGQALLAEYAG